MIWGILAQIWPFILGLVTVVAAYLTGRTSGKKSQQVNSLIDETKKQEAGRNAVAKEKRATADADKRDILSRLRGRDWH